MLDALPLCFAASISYFIFGILAASDDTSLLQAIAATAAIYSSPLQLILLESDGSIWVLLPVIMALNSRFMLMSMALMPYIATAPGYQKLIALHLIVPPTFAAAMLRLPSLCQGHVSYYLGLAATLYLTGMLSTLGGLFVDSERYLGSASRIGEILVALLFVILAGQLRDRPIELAGFGAGFGLAPFFLEYLGSFAFVLGPVAIGGLLSLLPVDGSDKQGET